MPNPSSVFRHSLGCIYISMCIYINVVAANSVLQVAVVSFCVFVFFVLFYTLSSNELNLLMSYNFDLNSDKFDKPLKYLNCNDHNFNVPRVQIPFPFSPRPLGWQGRMVNWGLFHSCSSPGLWDGKGE